MRKRIRGTVIGVMLFMWSGLLIVAGDVVGGVAELPMTRDHNRFTVDLDWVHGDGSTRRIRAWVDLGGTTVTISETLAKELGMDLSAMPAQGGHTFVTQVPLPVLKLGGMRLDTAGMTVSVFPGPFSRPGVQAQCTVPARCFRQLHVVFDYPEGKLILARPGVLKPRGVTVPIEVNPETGLCMITSTIDGEPVPLGLDTGSAGTWVSNSLTSAWQSRHADWPRLIGAAGSTNFFGFPFEAQGVLMMLPQLAVAKDVVAGETAVLGLDQGMFDWYSQKSAAPVRGFLGGDLLGRFRIEVDFSTRKSWWSPGKEPVRRDLDLVPLSLRPHADGSFTVAGVVAKEGNPLITDVLTGDRLLGIDSLEVTASPMGRVIDALRGRPGETRTLRLEREGKRITVQANVVSMSDLLGRKETSRGEGKSEGGRWR